MRSRVVIHLAVPVASIGFFFLLAWSAGCGGGSSSGGVSPPNDLSYASPATGTVGAAMSALSPTVTGTVSSFSVDPALPHGLSLDTSTGVISGIPTLSSPPAVYSIKATNAGGSASFSLPLAIYPPVSLALSATSLTFDNQLESTASPAQTLAIVNVGPTSFSVAGIAISGPAASSFAETSACGTVSAGGTCVLQVTFTPRASGPLSATLAIDTSAGNGNVALAGVGVPFDFSFSPAILPAGQTATLSWAAPNASSCTASGAWGGQEPTAGTQTVTQSSPGYYTYTLDCTGTMGTNSLSAVLTAYGSTPSVPEPASELGYQANFYVAPSDNRYVGLETTLVTPPLPPVPTASAAALFLWPGLDPASESANFNPINNGVIQPVLSWGPSCAPTTQPTPFSSWWISAQYVNVFGNDPGYTGCLSGSSMLVSPGDLLLINLSLDPNTPVWTETVTDTNTNQTVTFSIDLENQGQNWAYWAMEFWYGATINTPVTFTHTTLIFASPDTAGWCASSQGASNFYIYTPPTPQNSATQCFLRSIVLTKPH
ncbi:MAG TPA: choice-of-anchor D domain-containing protein [Candidatus Cybelea sp.]|nr:choice-of-anchor D domain-containing protein [Candidatus Cybelea sp.]